MTLMYPVSKIVKNVFVLTGGKYPPKWIMKALYNYEKSGKLKDFFDDIRGGDKTEVLDNNKIDEQQ